MIALQLGVGRGVLVVWAGDVGWGVLGCVAESELGCELGCEPGMCGGDVWRRVSWVVGRGVGWEVGWGGGGVERGGFLGGCCAPSAAKT